MAFERQWPAVAPQLLTANGGSLGQIQVDSTLGFKVGAQAFLKALTLPDFQVKVIRVISPTMLLVGVPTAPVGKRQYANVSAYTIALGASIAAPEQDKVEVPMIDTIRATYDGEPTSAWRTVFVDPNGDYYGSGNPLPIAFDGTISVGNVTIQDDDGDELEINPDGSINVNIVNAVTGNVVKNTYGEANAVPPGVETTIVQYMVPLIVTSGILQRISVSGTNVGRYKVYVNGVAIDTRRTYYGGSFNEYFDYYVNSTDGYTLQPGDLVTVRILHDRVYVGDFEGRIQVLEVA